MLTLLFLALFLAAISFTGVTTLMATHQTVTRLVDQRLSDVSDALTGRRGSGIATVLDRVRDASRERDTGDLGFVLRDPAGRLLFANVAPQQPLPPGFSPLDRRAGIKGLSYGRALVRPLAGGGSLAVIGETEPIDNYNRARAFNYVLGFGSVVLVVLGGVCAFAVTIQRRIAALNRTARAIIYGDLSRRVPDGGTASEFDEQARTFNRMLDRITALMGEIGNVTSDIAHDLRTPLARLRGQLVALERGAPDPETRAGIAAAVAQSDELLAMFAAMLRIGELEAGNRRAGFAPVDVVALVRELGETMEPVAVDAGRQLRVEAHGACRVSGDRQLLIQLCVNLIENAIRHTPPGSRIRLAAADTGTRLLLTVEDDGPGIPPAERKLAMRRFGRLDRAREGGGHGLGLPLADAIARLHHGTLLLEDAAPGLRVVVALPLG